MGGFLLITESLVSLESVRARIDQVLQASGKAKEVLDYVASTRGKGLRPSLVLLIMELCGGTKMAEAIECATGVELIHMASLIHDDVIDRSDLRRGLPTVHHRFGTQTAVLAGDHLFASAFHLFALSSDRRVSQVMTKVIQDMCAGEINQLLSPVTTEDDYFNYIHKKTACLIGGCCRLGAILAGRSVVEEYRFQTFGENIGLAFQLTDDVLDYRGDDSVMGKTSGKDFDEKLWTLPIILAYNRHLVGNDWHTSDFAEIRSLLETHGILDEVWQLAATYVQRAIGALKQCPESTPKRELTRLVEHIVERSY